MPPSKNKKVLLDLGGQSAVRAGSFDIFSHNNSPWGLCYCLASGFGGTPLFGTPPERGLKKLRRDIAVFIPSGLELGTPLARNQDQPPLRINAASGNRLAVYFTFKGERQIQGEFRIADMP